MWHGACAKLSHRRAVTHTHSRGPMSWPTCVCEPEPSKHGQCVARQLAIKPSAPRPLLAALIPQHPSRSPASFIAGLAGLRSLYARRSHAPLSALVKELGEGYIYRVRM